MPHPDATPVGGRYRNVIPLFKPFGQRLGKSPGKHPRMESVERFLLAAFQTQSPVIHIIFNVDSVLSVVMGNRSAGTGPLPGTKLENFPQWQLGHAKFLTCLHPGAQKTSNRCKPIMAK